MFQNQRKILASSSHDTIRCRPRNLHDLYKLFYGQYSSSSLSNREDVEKIKIKASVLHLHMVGRWSPAGSFSCG